MSDTECPVHCGWRPPLEVHTSVLNSWVMLAAKRNLLLQLEETRNTMERQRLLRRLWQLDHARVEEDQGDDRDRYPAPIAVAVAAK